jgi:hypothetical protein
MPAVACKADQAGVLYRGGDSLTNGTQCGIDAKLLRQLGANVVRVDQSAFTSTVADCLRAFVEQDLYVLASLGQFQPCNLYVSLGLERPRDLQLDTNVVLE